LYGAREKGGGSHPAGRGGGVSSEKTTRGKDLPIIGERSAPKKKKRGIRIAGGGGKLFKKKRKGGEKKNPGLAGVNAGRVNRKKKEKIALSLEKQQRGGASTAFHGPFAEGATWDF